MEFARCLAGSYSIMLLDEPSSGLDEVETAEFGRILREAMQDDGVGVLIVEHDMSLVMSVCDVIYVMEFGAVIFHGTPEEVRASEVVRAAYLGGELDESASLAVDAGAAQ